METEVGSKPCTTGGRAAASGCRDRPRQRQQVSRDGMYDLTSEDRIQSWSWSSRKGRWAMRNSRVDEYVARLERWCDEFAALRTILLDTELTEAFKWYKPCYT